MLTSSWNENLDPIPYTLDSTPNVDTSQSIVFRRGLQAAEDAYTDSLAGSTSNAVVWANRSAARLACGKGDLALLDARMARTVDPTYAKVPNRHVHTFHTHHY